MGNFLAIDLVEACTHFLNKLAIQMYLMQCSDNAISYQSFVLPCLMLDSLAFYKATRHLHWCLLRYYVALLHSILFPICSYICTSTVSMKSPFRSWQSQNLAITYVASNLLIALFTYHNYVHVIANTFYFQMMMMIMNMKLLHWLSLQVTHHQMT